ncbi:hypothetical protein ON010_g2811 [Phytophthora cinnamomi]|nr:hypothetical protein ON010_g2811 [Phytophthora cinnamomi]
MTAPPVFSSLVAWTTGTFRPHSTVTGTISSKPTSAYRPHPTSPRIFQSPCLQRSAPRLALRAWPPADWPSTCRSHRLSSAERSTLAKLPAADGHGAEGRAFTAEGLGSTSEPGCHAHVEDEVVQDCDTNNEAELKFSAPKTEVAESQPSSAISASAEPRHLAAVTDEEIFRVAERLAWKPKPDNQPYGTGALQREEILCHDCGSKRHKTENCWSKLICGRCHDDGHPTQYCRRQPCSKCGDYHRRGLCDMWSALKAVQEAIRAGGSVEGLDPETVQLLLDSSDPETPLNH